MKNIDDGVIKYDNSHFIKAPSIESAEYDQLEICRSALYQIKLIGCYEHNQIGYGNISCRKNYLHLHQTVRPQFLITGSQTGHIDSLTGEHYTRVIDYDIDHFSIVTHGPVTASSESLTHAAIYEAASHINAVIHIHSYPIWKGMIQENFPSTSRSIPYGTKEMATAVKALIQKGNENYFAMQGHNEGVVIFGTNLSEAMEQTIYLYQKFIDPEYSPKHV